MGKKLISLTLCLALLSGFLSGSTITKAETVNTDVIAVSPEKSDVSKAADIKKNEPSDKALEAAIKAAKSKIQIPGEYSEFNFYYSGTNTGSNTYWSLNWRNPEDYSYIEIDLDKDNNIINYYKYNGQKTGESIPSYRKNELLDEARDFILQIAPTVYIKMDFVDAYYDGLYSNSYTYCFQRKEKGVIFPDNTVTVSVDATTGEVKSASINWLYDAKTPSSDTKLTKEEAAKIIGDNLKMKLKYKMDSYRIYENGAYNTVKKAFLVYEPDISYISVDAKTGKVYLNRDEWVIKSGASWNNASTESKMDTGSAGGAALTDEEIAKIRELENLITKEKAIEAVTSNPYLYIDKNLITYTAILNKAYSANNKDKSYVWNIELRDDRPVDYSKDTDTYRAYASASVDARTGKILSFYASLDSNYDSQTGTWLPVKIKYDREYGKNVFEKFLSSQVKNRFNQTKLVGQRDDYVAYYNEKNEPVYGGYYYTYNRFNEGVEFEYNGIYGAVDGVTGKIYSYYTNWDDDIIFESPENAMTPEEAFKHYISKDGFNLIYEVNVINEYDPNYKSKDRYYEYSEAYSVTYEVRLVYRPDISPAYISPFTGEQLDYNGEVYKGRETYSYKDIDDTEENCEILLLADMNIGFKGGYFNPENKVTQEEVKQLLEDLGYYYDDNANAKDTTKLITREELAYNLVKRLGLEKVAGLSGIYNTGYYDENNIKSDYLGAVALAKGFKIFPEYENNMFYPKNNLTRRELVSIVFNFIKAYKDVRY